MGDRSRSSRRAATWLLLLGPGFIRASLWGGGLLAPSGWASAQPADRDPVVIVELTTKNLRTFKKVLRSKSIEVIRAIPPRGDGEIATAIIALKRSAAVELMRIADLKVEIVSQPPTVQSEIPEVGRGNRFADPKVIPRGRGVLVAPT